MSKRVYFCNFIRFYITLSGELSSQVMQKTTTTQLCAMDNNNRDLINYAIVSLISAFIYPFVCLTSQMLSLMLHFMILCHSLKQSCRQSLFHFVTSFYIMLLRISYFSNCFLAKKQNKKKQQECSKSNVIMPLQHCESHTDSFI